MTALESNKPLLLHGAWRLPVLPEETVKPERATRENGLLQRTGVPYTAVVALHLLVTGSASATPAAYRLQLPVSANLEAGAGTGNRRAASGYFTIDLANLPDFPLHEQTLFVYAFSKEVTTGPLPMAILDRRRHD